MNTEMKMSPLTARRTPPPAPPLPTMTRARSRGFRRCHKPPQDTPNNPLGQYHLFELSYFIILSKHIFLRKL